VDSQRWAWAEIDLQAIRHNVSVIRQTVAPASLLAVVKADAYGHGAAQVAAAALQAGAIALGVALVQEGVELRRAGIDAPILLMSQQPPEQSGDIVRFDLTPTVYDVAGIDALDRSAIEQHREIVAVHVKVDTGMHRVGCPPEDIGELVQRIEGSRRLRLAGLFTHLAVADEPGNPHTGEQLDRFDDVIRPVVAGSADRGAVVIHAANSAGALAHRRARYGLVRIGIALYGLEPGGGVAGLCGDLQPALSLKARVSHIKRLTAGERLSYGLSYRLGRDANIATVPIGYADGVRRRLFQTGGEVLIGRRRRAIAGAVTMDQLMVDCGDDAVAVGDEVVLIGRQGDKQIRVEEWAKRLDTIPYEITCAISNRIARRYLNP
jgi:alanine racemase